MANRDEWSGDGGIDGGRIIKFGFIAVVLLMMGLGVYGCVSLLSYEPEWVQTTHDRELWKRFGKGYGEIASKMEHYLEEKYGVFPHDIINSESEIMNGAPFPSLLWYQFNLSAEIDGKEVNFYVRTEKDGTIINDTYLFEQIKDEYLDYMNNEMQKYFGRTKIFMDLESVYYRFNNDWSTKEEFWETVYNHAYVGSDLFVYVDYEAFNGVEGFEDALKLFWQDWHKGEETEPLINLYYMNKKMFEQIDEDIRKKLVYSQYKYAVLIETTNERAITARYFTFDGNPILAINHTISSLKPGGQCNAQITAYNLNVEDLRYELPMPDSGTITEDGIYTAPDKEGEYLVRAYYVSDPSVSIEYTQVVRELYSDSDLVEPVKSGMRTTNRFVLLENGERRKIRVSFFNMEPVEVKYELDHEYESEHTVPGQDIGILTEDGIYTAPQEAPVEVRYWVYAINDPSLRAVGFFHVFREEDI
jgi:hypothetical protein